MALPSYVSKSLQNGSHKMSLLEKITAAKLARMATFSVHVKMESEKALSMEQRPRRPAGGVVLGFG
jgi:hypothetical protein